MAIQNMTGTLPRYSDTSDLANSMASSQEYSRNARDFRQRKLADALAAKYMQADGNLNDTAYVTDAAKQGLGLPYINEAFNYRTGQFENAAKQAEARARVAGVTKGDLTPVIGHGSGPVGDPGHYTVTTTTNPDGSTRKETRDPKGTLINVEEAESWMKGIPPDKGMPQQQPTTDKGNWFTNMFRSKEKPKFSSEFLPGTGKGNGNGNEGQEQMGGPQLTPEQQEQVRRQQQAPSGFATEDTTKPTVMDVGTGMLSVPTVNELEPTTETQYYPVKDTRSYLSRAEDMPLRSEFFEDPTAAHAEAEDANSPDPRFQWTPANDMSGNQFRMFGDALQADLGSMGYKKLDANGNYDVAANSHDYLKNVYDSTLAKSITAPLPNPMQFGRGPEGRAKYFEELQKYNADVAHARGEADAAVIAARSALSDKAKKFGESTVENRKSQIGGDILLDPAKRNEAAALKTNLHVSQYAKDAVKKAGDDITKLSMASTQVIAAYAQATNPGQPLPEGKRMELVESLFPERAKDDAFKIKAAAAIGRFVISGDPSALSIVTNQMNAMSPQALSARLTKLADEAHKLTVSNIPNYIEAKAPVKQTAADTLGIGKNVKPKPKTGSTATPPMPASLKGKGIW